MSTEDYAVLSRNKDPYNIGNRDIRLVLDSSNRLDDIIYSNFDTDFKQELQFDIINSGSQQNLGVQQNVFNENVIINGKLTVNNIDVFSDISVNGTLTSTTMASNNVNPNVDYFIDTNAPGNGFKDFFDNPAEVFDIIKLSNGEYVFCGNFRKYNDYNATKIIKFDINGNVDQGFLNNINTINPNGVFYYGFEQNNGKILFYTDSTNFNGGNSTLIVRLNADGTSDDTFNQNIYNDSISNSITANNINQYSNGPYGTLRHDFIDLGENGYFVNYGTTVYDFGYGATFVEDSYMIRFNDDGNILNVITSVYPVSKIVNINSTYVVYANYVNPNPLLSVNGEGRLYKCNALTGDLDSTFSTNFGTTGFDSIVFDLKLYDDYIMVAGGFTRYNDTEEVRFLYQISYDGEQVINTFYTNFQNTIYAFNNDPISDDWAEYTLVGSTENHTLAIYHIDIDDNYFYMTTKLSKYGTDIANGIIQTDSSTAAYINKSNDFFMGIGKDIRPYTKIKKYDDKLFINHIEVFNQKFVNGLVILDANYNIYSSSGLVTESNIINKNEFSFCNIRTEGNYITVQNEFGFIYNINQNVNNLIETSIEISKYNQYLDIVNSDFDVLTSGSGYDYFGGLLGTTSYLQKYGTIVKFNEFGYYKINLNLNLYPSNDQIPADMKLILKFYLDSNYNDFHDIRFYSNPLSTFKPTIYKVIELNTTSYLNIYENYHTLTYEDVLLCPNGTTLQLKVETLNGTTFYTGTTGFLQYDSTLYIQKLT